MKTLFARSTTRIAAVSALVAASLFISALPASAVTPDYGGSFGNHHYSTSVERTSTSNSSLGVERVCDNWNKWCYETQVRVDQWDTGTRIAVTSVGAAPTMIWFDRHRRLLDVPYAMPDYYMLTEGRTVRNFSGSAYRELVGYNGYRYIDVRQRGVNGGYTWIRFDRSRIEAEDNGAIFQLNQLVASINAVAYQEATVGSAMVLGASGNEYIAAAWKGSSAVGATVTLCGVVASLCAAARPIFGRTEEANMAARWLFDRGYGWAPEGGN